VKYLALFFTHSGAIKFERLLAKKNLKGRTMPVPRKLSSSCGVCNTFDCDSEHYEEFISDDVESFYRVDGKDYEELYRSE